MLKLIELGEIEHYRSCYRRIAVFEDANGGKHNRTLYGTVKSIELYEIGGYYEI